MSLEPLTYISAVHPDNLEVAGHFSLDNPFIVNLQVQGFKLGQDFITDEGRGMFFARGKAAPWTADWFAACPNWKITRLEFTLYFPGIDYGAILLNAVECSRAEHPRIRPWITEKRAGWGGKNAEVVLWLNNLGKKGISADVRLRRDWALQLWGLINQPKADYVHFLEMYRRLELYLFGVTPFIKTIFD